MEERECRSREKGVTITGHSLGAAAAAIAAVDLAQDYEIRRVYTYGQPRTGNRAFSDVFAERLGDTPFFRVVDYKDLVPHLPPNNLLGYVSLMPEVYYNATALGHYTICNDGEDNNCSFQWILPGLKTPHRHSKQSNKQSCNKLETNKQNNQADRKTGSNEKSKSTKQINQTNRQIANTTAQTMNSGGKPKP